MAGYIMTLNDIEGLEKCIKTGTYSYMFPEQNSGKWSTAMEGTFADYLSMKAGDNIYFFIKRKLYGIGVLVNIGNDCKYLNYIDADKPVQISNESFRKLKPLTEYGGPNNRCICTFKPDPFFFKKSVDMDEVLSSNPSRFRMLRAMWKVSFIKVDDEENQALIDIILKRNEDSIFTGSNTYQFDDSIHKQIENSVATYNRLSAYNLLIHNDNNTAVKHEMSIEAYLCSVLGKENNLPFGSWDYISHQVIASPFKPIDYMDKMDVFGYRRIKGYSTISKYLVIEIKKDEADTQVIDQIMKYVDWVNQEYAHGDYSMIEAYIVANRFPEEVIKKKQLDCVRNYTKGFRPSEPAIWSSLKLIQYNFIEDRLVFEDIGVKANPSKEIMIGDAKNPLDPQEAMW